eukprot:7998-Heterococcus_DN1.PRE.2
MVVAQSDIGGNRQLGRIAIKSITLAGAALLNHGCYQSELFAAHRMCHLGHAIIDDQLIVCRARSKHLQAQLCCDGTLRTSAALFHCAHERYHGHLSPQSVCYVAMQVFHD